MITDRPSAIRHRFARAGVAFFLFGAAALGVATACGDDDETNNFIGITDAEPPRLGTTAPDGGR
jgi:hypothetical protein